MGKLSGVEDPGKRELDVPPPPPRAFTQGVGTVFQFVGVTFFLLMMFVCCGSGLLSKEAATRADLTRIGWHLPGDAPDRPFYSAAMAMTVSVFGGVFLGIALAGLGLGLQAQHRRAPWGAGFVTLLATVFWIVQAIFAIQVGGSILLMSLAIGLALLFTTLFGLSVGAIREMRRDPPPVDHEVLPSDYRIPYSHLHQDPPEVRLAAEIEQRRQRLAVQQKELEALEERAKRKYPPP